MSVVDEGNVKEEMVVFMRNSDILTVAERGVTTTSETFSGTGAPQVLTLTNNVVRNIRSVNDGSAKSAYSDYTPSYSASTTTVSGTFASGTDNITVSYDYSTGATEAIWGDYPELGELDAGDFPRVGFDFISSVSEPLGIGDTNYMSSKLMNVRVYDNKTSVIDRAMTTLRQAIKDNQKSFYYYKFVKMSTITPLIPHEEFKRKIRERGIDFELQFAFET